MSGGIEAVWHGVKEFEAAIVAQNERVNAATLAALKANQNLIKRNVRSRLRGKPRWNHRGKSRRTGPEVNIDTGKGHTPRSGGPGKFTGKLYRGVGGVRKPKWNGVYWEGGVGVGGGVRNLYKKRVEAQFPYFKPAVEKSEAAVEATWAKAWGRAMSKGK